MKTECNLKTIKAGILDAMMRTTDLYREYARPSKKAPTALVPKASLYVSQGFNNTCQVCALGSLLCSRLSTVPKKALRSTPTMWENISHDWGYIPDHLQCFDKLTLAVLETIFEATDPGDRASDAYYPEYADIYDAWAEASSDEEVDECCLAGMAEFDDTERLLASLQFLYDRKGKLVPADILKFGDTHFVGKLVKKGKRAAKKAAKAYLEGITDRKDRVHAQKALATL